MQLNKIIIDDEFQALLCPLDDETLAGLEHIYNFGHSKKLPLKFTAEAAMAKRNRNPANKNKQA